MWCGARNGRAASSGCAGSTRPATLCTALATTASSGSSGGSRTRNARASSVFRARRPMRGGVTACGRDLGARFGVRDRDVGGRSRCAHRRGRWAAAPRALAGEGATAARSVGTPRRARRRRCYGALSRHTRSRRRQRRRTRKRGMTRGPVESPVERDSRAECETYSRAARRAKNARALARSKPVPSLFRSAARGSRRSGWQRELEPGVADRGAHAFRAVLDRRSGSQRRLKRRQAVARDSTVTGAASRTTAHEGMRATAARGQRPCRTGHLSQNIGWDRGRYVRIGRGCR